MNTILGRCQNTGEVPGMGERKKNGERTKSVDVFGSLASAKQAEGQLFCQRKAKLLFLVERATVQLPGKEKGLRAEVQDGGTLYWE